MVWSPSGPVKRVGVGPEPRSHLTSEAKPGFGFVCQPFGSSSKLKPRVRKAGGGAGGAGGGGGGRGGSGGGGGGGLGWWSL